MAGFSGILKTIFIPAVISLLLYLALTFAVLPFVRRYRQRYNQYLPLDAISDRTTNLRHTVSDALMSFVLPSHWRRGQNRRVVDGSFGVENEDELFDDEEGEAMAGFQVDDRRREALDTRRSMAADEERRLSRDLEEGFKDDSDDESEEVVVRR